MTESLSSQVQYSIRTWDGEANAYTKQAGVPEIVTGMFPGLRDAIRALRLIGYPCNRSQYDSDPAGLIERVSPEA